MSFSPARAKKEQRAAVQAVMRLHLDEMNRLAQHEVQALLPILRLAQAELTSKLKDWVERSPDGGLRFTAWKYRGALAQLKAIVGHLEAGMRDTLLHGTMAAQKLALKHVADELVKFSVIFGGQSPVVQFNLARVVMAGKAPYRSAAERYAWGKRVGVWQDMQKTLAVEILKGASVTEMIDKLQALGGPRGLITTRGVAGEDNANIELIPEGLFARYRSRAETYVRTELAVAYGTQAHEGLVAARESVPDLKRRWCADGGGCRHICQPMDGQVVGIDEPFVDGMGHSLIDQPAHPRCRCRVGAWRDHWPRLLDSLGIT